MNKFKFIATLLTICFSLSVFAQKPYKADWESLKKYEIPQWYKDAKFGIFIHWGPTTVPAKDSEWYGYHMWNEGTVDALGNPTSEPSRAYQYHVENFGKPEDYGYTKFIPEFKAENFNAKEWIDLFNEAGAKYVVPVGEHCDGFALYNSKVTRWNAVNMGPKRDIVGELFKEAKNKDMKVGMSSHYAYAWHWWTYDEKYETTDPKLQDFYWKAHERWSPATPEFVNHWYKRTIDMMTQYKPDLMWFDLGLCEPEYEEARKKYLAKYYNQGLKNNQEVVVNYKNIKWKPIPDGAAVLDIESGKLDRIREETWQTDMSLGGWRWGFSKPYDMRKPGAYINDLIDIVSKNGVLLLNVAPNKHGEIPADQQAILKEIGAWLKINGEGIYSTTPFTVFGQGPTNAKMVLHGNMKDKGFTADDVRYTQKGQTIYAFLLEWEEGKETLSLSALGSENRVINDAIKSVSIMGYDETINWIQKDNELIIQLPKERPVKNAIGFKIELDDAPSDIFKTK
ncbi:alpha-L-fucosidase [Saccharicrinis aurantiacus]|uniref:alpha-L-fucosidase n=1 Tax=Saccharicrinis aurantiacus TaxID=1849719 RepID=UPI00094FAE18|nr:alpha-L-fucosidase [Saccharicrinis aurantiacus]